MPYRSEAQRRFFHANAEKLKKQGVDIQEWDEASKGKDLPQRVHPHKQAQELAAKFRKRGDKHA